LESDSEQKKRRRSVNYPLEIKPQLAQLVCDDSISVAQLAMRHGLDTNMLFSLEAAAAHGIAL
jgi:transposase